MTEAELAALEQEIQDLRRRVEALQAEIESKKDRPTGEYFPLYRFRIPPEAVDQAIEQQPEPERSRIRTEQEKAKGQR